MTLKYTHVSQNLLITCDFEKDKSKGKTLLAVNRIRLNLPDRKFYLKRTNEKASVRFVAEAEDDNIVINQSIKNRVPELHPK